MCLYKRKRREERQGGRGISGQEWGVFCVMEMGMEMMTRVENGYEREEKRKRRINKKGRSWQYAGCEFSLCPSFHVSHPSLSSPRPKSHDVQFSEVAFSFWKATIAVVALCCSFQCRDVCWL